MNTNTGYDPMLCSGNWRTISKGDFSIAFTLPTEGLLSPEPNSAFTDLSSLWSGEGKHIPYIKEEPIDDEEDEGILCNTSSSDPGDDMGLDDIEIESSTSVDIKSELDVDSDFNEDNVSMINSVESFDQAHSPAWSTSSKTNNLNLSEKEARKYVQEQFEKIAFLPGAKLSHREKINFILAQSDCKDFTVDDILNFDKRKSESARACANIVQNIPQRYRWECVIPEDIPSCYTIVADCKKISSRDKPPRPMNAFMIWAQGSRRLINVLCPKMQNALISEALGYYWRLKSDDFKHRFEQEKIKLRQFHNIEFPEYKYKPKTKVQKAKEKQELSITKAKIRASLKRERLQERKLQQSPIATSNQPEIRVGVKCGRPKKVKTLLEHNSLPLTKPKNNKSKPKSEPKVSRSNEIVKTSPTKPAIKDMLTFKIMNDRRSKEQTCNADSSSRKYSSVSPITRNDATSDIFDQLSPLMTDRQPAVSDLLDELTSLESFVNEGFGESSLFRNDSQPSSVYDTPANTPPTDDERTQCLHNLPIISPSPPSRHFPQSSPQISLSPLSCRPISPVSTPSPKPSFQELTQIPPPSLSTSAPTVLPMQRGQNTFMLLPTRPVLAQSNTLPIKCTKPTKGSSLTQTLMPSLSAMLSSPAKTRSPFRTATQNFQLNSVCRASPSLAKPVIYASTAHTSGHFPNIYSLQLVGKNVTAIPFQTNISTKPTAGVGKRLATCALRTTVDNATNSRTFPIVNRLVSGDNYKRGVLSENIDANNNNHTVKVPPPSYAMSMGVMNPKVLYTQISDVSDLDSLSKDLELDVPLLSEDVMRSYIDSL